jgi:hypothetical protein
MSWFTAPTQTFSFLLYNIAQTDSAGMHSCDWHSHVTRSTFPLYKPSQDTSLALGHVASTYSMCYSQDMCQGLTGPCARREQVLVNQWLAKQDLIKVKIKPR